MHLPNEELWQSTLVHVIRITLEMVFRESQGMQVPCVGFFTLLGVCVIARVLLLS